MAQLLKESCNDSTFSVLLSLIGVNVGVEVGTDHTDDAGVCAPARNDKPPIIDERVAFLKLVGDAKAEGGAAWTGQNRVVRGSLTG
jgi:hypothetical protein